MKLGLLITTYERPDYLYRCLESLKTSGITKDIQVLIVDDNSKDERVIQFASDFCELKICRKLVCTISSFWNRNAQIRRAELCILRREGGTRKAKLNNEWFLLLYAACNRRDPQLVREDVATV